MALSLGGWNGHSVTAPQLFRVELWILRRVETERSIFRRLPGDGRSTTHDRRVRFSEAAVVLADVACGVATHADVRKIVVRTHASCWDCETFHVPSSNALRHAAASWQLGARRRAASSALWSLVEVVACASSAAPLQAVRAVALTSARSRQGEGDDSGHEETSSKGRSREPPLARHEGIPARVV